MPSSGSCGASTRGVIFNFGYLGTNKKRSADPDLSCRKYPYRTTRRRRSGIVRSECVGPRGSASHVPGAPQHSFSPKPAHRSARLFWITSRDWRGPGGQGASRGPHHVRVRTAPTQRPRIHTLASTQNSSSDPLVRRGPRSVTPRYTDLDYKSKRPIGRGEWRLLTRHLPARRGVR